MEVKEAIEKRRAYRSLEKVLITEDTIQDLAESAQLAPSCFNNQPWRFVFVINEEILHSVFDTLSQSNTWAHSASMVIAVFTKKELDCLNKQREYSFFDTGMAAAFIILRATELQLVAHPIAGFDEQKVKSILRIPEDMRVLTLMIVGKHSKEINPVLSETQVKSERKRPERLPLSKFMYINRYKEDYNG